MGGTGINAKGVRVTANDIHQLSGQTDAWAEALHEFDDRIAPLLPASLDKLDRTRSLSLEFDRIKRRHGTATKAP